MMVPSLLIWWWLKYMSNRACLMLSEWTDMIILTDTAVFMALKLSGRLLDR